MWILRINFCNVEQDFDKKGGEIIGTELRGSVSITYNRPNAIATHGFRGTQRSMTLCLKN